MARGSNPRGAAAGRKGICEILRESPQDLGLALGEGVGRMRQESGLNSVSGLGLGHWGCAPCECAWETDWFGEEDEFHHGHVESELPMRPGGKNCVS